MAGSVVVEQTSVSVVPGEMGTCSVRVRNTGAVVDQFTLTVLGQPAAWTTVVPAALSLFPGADGTIELHFAPPRAPGVGSGAVPFGVRVVGSEDPDNPVVEEGEVNLLPFVDVTGKLTPRTSEAKRKAKHEIVLDNKGNTPVGVSLSVTDPDEQLVFGLHESLVTVEAGQSAHVPLKVAAKKGFARGADKHRPFSVTARPDGAAFPLTMDGNLIQKPGMPRFVLPLVAGVVAVALMAALLPGMLKGGGKGNLQLASEDAPTTTVAEAPAEEDDGSAEDGPATPEEAQAAAAAELAANGKDPDDPAAGGGSGGSGGGGGDTAAASTGGGGGGPATTVPNTNDDGPAVTAAPATTAAPPPGAAPTTAPPTTTTAPPTTTTTVPSRDGSVRGTYSYDFDAGAETSTGADVFWNQLTQTSRQLQPSNGAQLFNMGAANYDAVTKAQLQGLAYSTNAINGSDSGNQMPPGTVIAIKTNTGRFAKMKVVAKEPYPANTLTFRFYTYP